MDLSRLSIGAVTDLQIMALTGSQLEEHPDHLVIRTPSNPEFHWGHSIFVTDPGCVDDADRWMAAFEQNFPDASHRAFGFVRPPSDEAWELSGLSRESEQALISQTPLVPTPLDSAYCLRAITTPQDWAAADALTREGQPVEIHSFLQTSVACDRRLSEQGAACFFGAFHGDELAARLGIVLCGNAIARYRRVATHASHRRKGLASHLLGVAAVWAADHGCTQWVIVADTHSEAEQLYRQRGFERATQQIGYYRC